MPSFSALTGWLALACIVGAGLVPLFNRLTLGRRPAPDAMPTRLHVYVGIVTAALAAIHTLAVLPALGSPDVIGAGTLALVPGALAFLIVLAHVGVGLQLRDPKLKRRVPKRRTHLITATLLLLTATAHALALLLAHRAV